MKRFLLPLTLIIVALWAALQPQEILTFSASFFPLRKAYTALTGALALTWMAFCMMLALRPARLERALGGLDRLYFLHKWTGVAAVSMVVIHWLLVLSPKTLIAWGWVEAATRPPRARGGGFSWIAQAKDVGEWAAWGIVVLGIVSLLRFFPYGVFRKLHKGLPVIFLLAAYHGVMMLLREKLLATPFGVALTVIALTGAVIAVISLLGRIGANRSHVGRVTHATVDDSGVLDLRIALDDWPGHAPGQFALLTFDRQEGRHPFSIVSDWKPGAELAFAIKPLGDYTRTLPGRIQPGATVTVEGPYGRFDFGDIGDDEVWVAGGVGIAPFLSRLQRLASEGGARGDVYLFYSVHDRDDAAFPDGLETLCQNARVQLHRRISTEAGRFSAAEIGQYARNARGVWFCGPARWGRRLREALSRDFGVDKRRFHSERFEFR